MSDTTICLKPVNDLLEESFFIPSYQRGYRWKERQVTDLLNDLWDFQADCKDDEKFYCLQPVVVTKRLDGQWEVVDGQQRLTTIYLILTSLQKQVELMEKSRFTIDFETRSETSGAFLKNIDPAQSDANIDYHHIWPGAYDAINQWFDDWDGPRKSKFLQSFVHSDELGRNAKVIWYELPDGDDPVEAFTRLNVGKIPLTNAELIRALFLQSGNFEENKLDLVRLTIAQEWDLIEKALQADDLWYFLHSGINSPASRIEFVFQLIAREGGAALGSDPFATFYFYNEKSGEVDAEEEWLTVKQYFMTLEEWFRDRTLYHLIGYLVHEGDDILAIRKASAETTKSEFQRKLKQRVFRRVIGGDLPKGGTLDEVTAIIRSKIDGLEYGADSAKIRSLLLLFNIATLLQNSASNLRFPFDSFKKENWDIEHVRSVQSGRPNARKLQRMWLENVRDHLSDVDGDKHLRDKAKEVLDTDPWDKDKFNAIYDVVLNHFGEADDTDVDNGIGNLALLDARTNRSYKNAVFPVKRRRILGLDRVGTFVPLCTKNLFLKCYIPNSGKMMFWSQEDRDAYRDAIIETLAQFFVPKEGATS